jgi:hypothetical protein
MYNPFNSFNFSFVLFSYQFNYLAAKGRVFLCVCNSEFQTRVAFAFLQKIQSRYQPDAETNFEEMLVQEMVTQTIK